MDESKVKAEPKSPAASSPMPGAFPDHSGPSNEAKKPIERSMAFSKMTTPAWKEDNGHDMFVQVKTREDAVKAGLEFLTGLQSSLKEHCSEVPSAKKWIDRIKTIRTDKKKCRVLIGLLGTTGAGKSSMINALLEHEDLLPADDEKACTAVCVEIAWNENDDPAAAYHAQIECISEDDWRSEIETLFKDISDRAQNKDGEDGEADLERDLRITTAFAKLKSVYPHLKTPADLKAWNAQSLVSHSNVKNILGKTRDIKQPTKNSFAAAVKPYIDSSVVKEDGGKSFAQWPLVKVVRLAVKSEILKDGIVLVDLPGSMDTNAARGAIAEGYQKKLSVTCVVSRVSRASSDKPAQDMLGKVTQRTLQLDNRFSAESLCFIVSMTDVSLMVDRYIGSHPDLEEALAPEFAREAKDRDMMRRVQEFSSTKNQNRAICQSKVLELGSELKKLQPLMKKIEGGSSRGRKRKRTDNGDVQPQDSNQTPRSEEEKATIKRYKELQAEIKDTKDAISRIDSNLYKAQTKMQELERSLKNCMSRKTGQCIKNRNQILTADIRRDYETSVRQMGQQVGKKPLQVFCVSSWAFSALAKGHPLSGFPKVPETGIPQLQKWLVETTLSTRNQNALSFLEEIVSLELSMGPWVADSSAESKLTEAQKVAVESMFEKKVKNLEQTVVNANEWIVQKCEQTVNTDLFNKMTGCENKAATEAERVVKGWTQRPVVWATHRAVNKHRGEWKSSLGHEYKWNDDLAGLYLDPLIKSWAQTIHKKLPSYRGQYETDLAAYIKKFANTVVVKVIEICPDLQESIDQWKESTIRATAPIQKQSKVIFDDTIQDAAKEAHRLVKPKVVDFWGPVFDQCAEEFGRGHYKRNQTTHNDYVKKTARPMYKKASAAIRHAFRKMFDSLPEQFNEGTKPAVTQIKEEFEQFLLNHTVRGDSLTNEKGESIAKVKLQSEILGHIAELKTAWGQEVVVPPEVEEEESEDEEVNIDDLEEPDDADDDYIEIPSDSDED